MDEERARSLSDWPQRTIVAETEYVPMSTTSFCVFATRALAIRCRDEAKHSRLSHFCIENIDVRLCLNPPMFGAGSVALYPSHLYKMQDGNFSIATDGAERCGRRQCARRSRKDLFALISL